MERRDRARTGTPALKGERAWATLRVVSRLLLRGRVEARVEGLRHVPPVGPAVIACRHYHHLYDGCLLLASIERPVHFLVALDWVRSPWGRRAMELACAAAAWPVVLRPSRRGLPSTTAYRESERRAYLRRAVEQSVGILRDGGLLVVFPEAYPTVDPHGSPKVGRTAFLPFRPGFAGVVERAQKEGAASIPIVPAGLDYEAGRRWTVRLAFGSPLYVPDRASRSVLVADVERRVRQLSGVG